MPGHAWRAALAAGLAGALAVGCGGSSSTTAAGTGAGAGASVGPGGLPRNAWSWVDVPGSACSDGSQTGVAVNPGDGPDLLVFLMGGGACIDYVSCFVARTATAGPFGRPQFDQLVTSGLATGSILDRSDPANPFRDMSFVFFPYCTGDVHGGDNVVDYPDPLGRTHRWYHKGHANVVAALPQLAALFPAPRKLVVSGASGGGYGSLVNYDTFRSRWPAAAGMLLDDSGPPLAPGDLASPFVLAAWVTLWRLDEAIAPVCPQCVQNLALMFPALSKKYPADRVSLLSSLQDQTIRSFLFLTPTQFESELLALADGVIAPLPTARTFLVAGETHTMLGHPRDFSSAGVPLQTWLAQELSGDAAWASLRPPGTTAAAAAELPWATAPFSACGAGCAPRP